MPLLKLTVKTASKSKLLALSRPLKNLHFKYSKSPTNLSYMEETSWYFLQLIQFY